MVEGTVKFFNSTKNFGFITAEDGKDYFVHRSGIEDEKTLEQGDRVVFDVVDGERGPKAENVRKEE
ncbi:MAG: cold-shock protein [Candidatus Altiarchaeales archaeon]|nr:cold-shock protein [Candidatus Altiarchaeales archaeon]